MSYGAGINVSVFCNTGDLCKIVCLTNNACSNTTVIYECYHNVDIDCADDTGIGCPMVIVNESYCECKCEDNCETTDLNSLLLKMDNIVSYIVFGLVILCLILIIALTATCAALYVKSKEKQESIAPPAPLAPMPSKDAPQLEYESNNDDGNVIVYSANNGEVNVNEQQFQHE